MDISGHHQTIDIGFMEVKREEDAPKVVATYLRLALNSLTVVQVYFQPVSLDISV